MNSPIRRSASLESLNRAAGNEPISAPGGAQGQPFANAASRSTPNIPLSVPRGVQYDTLPTFDAGARGGVGSRAADTGGARARPQAAHLPIPDLGASDAARGGAPRARFAPAPQADAQRQQRQSNADYSDSEYSDYSDHGSDGYRDGDYLDGNDLDVEGLLGSLVPTGPGRTGPYRSAYTPQGDELGAAGDTSAQRPYRVRPPASPYRTRYGHGADAQGSQADRRQYGGFNTQVLGGRRTGTLTYEDEASVADVRRFAGDGVSLHDSRDLGYIRGAGKLSTTRRMGMFFRNGFRANISTSEIRNRIQHGNIDNLTRGRLSLLAYRLKKTFGEAAKERNRNKMAMIVAFAKKLERNYFGSPTYDMSELTRSKTDLKSFNRLQSIIVHGSIATRASSIQHGHLSTHAKSVGFQPTRTIQKLLGEFSRQYEKGLFNNTRTTQVDFLTWFKFVDKQSIVNKVPRRSIQNILTLIETNTDARYLRKNNTLARIDTALNTTPGLTADDISVLYALIEHTYGIQNNASRNLLARCFVDQIAYRGHLKRQTYSQYRQSNSAQQTQGQQGQARQEVDEDDLTSGPDHDFYGHQTQRAQNQSGSPRTGRNTRVSADYSDDSEAEFEAQQVRQPRAYRQRRSERSHKGRDRDNGRDPQSLDSQRRHRPRHSGQDVEPQRGQNIPAQAPIGAQQGDLTHPQFSGQDLTGSGSPVTTDGSGAQLPEYPYQLPPEATGDNLPLSVQISNLQVQIQRLNEQITLLQLRLHTTHTPADRTPIENDIATSSLILQGLRNRLSQLQAQQPQQQPQQPLQPQQSLQPQQPSVTPTTTPGVSGDTPALTLPEPRNPSQMTLPQRQINPAGHVQRYLARYQPQPNVQPSAWLVEALNTYGGYVSPLYEGDTATQQPPTLERLIAAWQRNYSLTLDQSRTMSLGLLRMQAEDQLPQTAIWMLTEVAKHAANLKPFAQDFLHQMQSIAYDMEDLAQFTAQNRQNQLGVQASSARYVTVMNNTTNHANSLTTQEDLVSILPLITGNTMREYVPGYDTDVVLRHLSNQMSGMDANADRIADFNYAASVLGVTDANLPFFIEGLDLMSYDNPAFYSWVLNVLIDNNNTSGMARSTPLSRQAVGDALVVLGQRSFQEPEIKMELINKFLLHPDMDYTQMPST